MKRNLNNQNAATPECTPAYEGELAKDLNRAAKPRHNQFGSTIKRCRSRERD
jgi:hypothetical protein